MRSTGSSLASGLLAALAASGAAGFPLQIRGTSSCPAVSGDFTIDNYKLYPENMDWDPVHCKLYISANFNATVLVYDPYAATHEILSFDGISGVDPFHVSGIDYDAYTQSMLFSANSGAPWVTSGANMTGANFVIRWDTATNSAAYTADLAPYTDRLPTIGNVTGGGFQDFAVDPAGNAYAPSVFHVPGLAKITRDGAVSRWYVGEPTTSSAWLYTGIIYHEASDKLVLASPYLGTLVTFDVGSATPAPKNVTMKNWPADGSYAPADLMCDALVNPARYGRDVLLCAEDLLQATTLWASRDGFETAEYIGSVADNSTADIAAWAWPTATAEVGGSIYVLNEYFHDLGVFDVAGNRSSFPFVDATAQLDALVVAAGYSVVEA